MSEASVRHLEAADYRNAVAIINRASIQGAEVEYVAALKARMLKHAEVLERLDQCDEPHKPTMAEVIDMEREN